ncbi:symplekin [Naegleria gruberi]|uniref:Symplekin n=1 Tax=Naegleria gruberi TaxID=5762 RepID=D2VIX7_NAEGR|nr:symplekin [Naegleria gruberi]EFC43101.1 symplekin [Naegleria gruberi]|eukprot:XP_002675845.1 symplekin [Naegleria gruberi]
MLIVKFAGNWKLLCSDNDLVNEYLPKILQIQHPVHPQDFKLFLSLLIEKVMNKVQNVSVENTKSCAETLSLILISTDSTNLMKRIITTSISIVRKSIELITLDPNNKHNSILFSHMSLLIKRILSYIDKDNEGIQTHAVHFIENLILMYSSINKSNMEINEENLSNLLSYLQLSGNTYKVQYIDPYPIDLSFVSSYAENGKVGCFNVENMRDEGARYLEKLIEKFKKEDCPSSVISVIIQALLNIAKQRHGFWNTIIPFLSNQAYYYLGKGRTNNTQKQTLKTLLKTAILFLLKMPETRHKWRPTILHGLGELDVSNTSIGMITKFVDKHTTVLKRKEPPAEEKEAKVRKNDISQASQNQTGAQPTQDLEPTSVLYISYVPNAMTNVELANTVLGNLSRIESKSNRPPKNLENSNQLVGVVMSALSSHYKKGNTYSSEEQQQYMSSVQLYLSEPIPSFNSSLVTVSVLQQQANPYQARQVATTPYGRSPYSRAAPVQSQKADPRLTQKDPRTAYVPDKSNAFSSNQSKASGDDSDEEEVVTYKQQTTVKQEKVAEPVEEDVKEDLSKQFKLKLSIVDDNCKQQLKKFNWNKMLMNEKGMKREGKDHYRIKLICLMAVRSAETDEQYQQLYNFIKEDVKGRFSLLMMWLYMEYKHSIEQEYNVKKEESSENRYTRLFHKFLLSFDKSESILARFLVQSPHITQYTLDYICKDLCESDNYIGHGLTALRDIVIYRQNLRERCLNMLLNYGIHQNSKIRTPAIQILRDKTLYTLFEKEITDFAYSSIMDMKPLIEQSTSTDEMVDEQESSTDANNEIIKRYSSLYLALSSSYCEATFEKLLNDVYANYKSSENMEPVVAVLEKDILSTVKSSLNRATVIQYLKNFKEAECLDISIKIMQQLSLQPQGIDENLSKVLIYTFFERNIKDPRMVLPILSQLTKEQAKEALPIVFKSVTDVELLKKNIISMVTANSKAEKSDKLSGDEILVILHQIEANSEVQSVAFNNTRNVLDACLIGDGKQLFTSQMLKTALQQIVDIVPVPKLVIRTAIQSLNLHNGLAQFLLKFSFPSLIKKRAYESKTILFGLAKCLSDKLTLFQPPKVVEFLLDLGELSETALLEVLEQQNLRDLFKETIQIQQHPRASHYNSLLANQQTTSGAEQK